MSKVLDFVEDYPYYMSLIGGGLLFIAISVHSIFERIKGKDFDFYSSPLVMILMFIPIICGLFCSLSLMLTNHIFWSAFVFISNFIILFVFGRIVAFFKWFNNQ